MKTTYLRYRGFYCEITFEPPDTIVEILLSTDHSRLPERVHFWSLDDDLRIKIMETIRFTLTDET